MLSSDFPPLHTVRAAFTAHGVPSNSVGTGFQTQLTHFVTAFFLLLRSQHRHHPLSVQIFFVILEAVFVVFSLLLLNPTCGYPSTAYLFTVSQVLCHYSHWNKVWLLPSREGIPIHRVISLQRPLRPQLSTFRYSYHWIPLGPSSKPASSHA